MHQIRHEEIILLSGNKILAKKILGKFIWISLLIKGDKNQYNTKCYFVDDIQFINTPVFIGPIWHVPKQTILLQNPTITTLHFNTHLLIMIGIFLCLSSFIAIWRGSVSPSSSTMTGAHMAICRALVPNTLALSYLVM